MKNFFAFALLAVFFSACGSEGDNMLGSDSGVAGSSGSNAFGLPNSTVAADGTTYVGVIGASIPWDTGSCTIPDVAKSSITAVFSRSFIAASNVLSCPDLSAFSDLKGLTCQEVVADVPAVAASFKKDSNTTMRVCCEQITAHLLANSYVASGYFDTLGVECGASSLIAGPLCSISGVFMGWACNGY